MLVVVCFVFEKELKKWTCAVVAERPTAKLLSKFCRETLLLIAEFNKRKWVPVEAQRWVGCYESGLATRCDIVLRDSVTKKLVLIEVKSGYADTFSSEEGKRESDFMKAPFKHLRANPFRFASIQLLLTWILHSTTFSNHSLEYANVMVAHVTSERLKLHKIPPSMAPGVRKVLAREMKKRNELFRLKTAKRKQQKVVYKHKKVQKRRKV